MKVNIRLVVLLIGIPTLLYGYIDPFTGSVALQVLIGGVFATLYMLRRSWQKIALTLWRRGSSRENGESVPDPAPRKQA